MRGVHGGVHGIFRSIARVTANAAGAGMSWGVHKRGNLMRARICTMLATSALALSIAGPVSASDNTSKWRDGFPAASAINANLGNYMTAPDIEISDFKGRWYACAEVRANPTTALATASYEPTPLNRSGVEAEARVYASAAKAKAAFDALSSNLQKCVGSRVEVSAPGSSAKWRASTSVGQVPAITEGGVPSLFVYLREAPVKGSSLKQAELGSSYEVITLSGPALLVVSGDVEGVSKLSSAQRDSVVSFAGDFIDTWAKAND